MAKFRKIASEIEANPFEWGMEDGIKRYNEYIPKDAGSYPIEMRSTEFPGYLKRYESELHERGFGDGQWKPTIKTKTSDYHIIEEGYWIITGEGARYAVSLDYLEKNYEPAE